MKILFILLFLLFSSNEKLLSQVWHLRVGETIPPGQHGIVIFGSTKIADPQIAKRISPNIQNSFAKAAAQPKIVIRLRCYYYYIQEPLLIIDGLVFENKKISEIDPNNIESINIIKDSLATALVGERGKCGIILIKTKVSAAIEASNKPSINKDSSKTKHMNVILNNALFKAFPNPVQSGTSLNIEWKQTEEGEYILQLFNQAGQLAFNKAMWIDKDARVLNLEVPHVAAGSYFLRMTNKNSGKAFTEKIIIQ